LLIGCPLKRLPKTVFNNIKYLPKKIIKPKNSFFSENVLFDFYFIAGAGILLLLNDCNILKIDHYQTSIRTNRGTFKALINIALSPKNKNYLL